MNVAVELVVQVAAVWCCCAVGVCVAFHFLLGRGARARRLSSRYPMAASS